MKRYDLDNKLSNALRELRLLHKCGDYPGVLDLQGFFLHDDPSNHIRFAYLQLPFVGEGQTGCTLKEWFAELRQARTRFAPAAAVR